MRTIGSDENGEGGRPDYDGIMGKDDQFCSREHRDRVASAATSDDRVTHREMQEAFRAGPCPFAEMEWYCILRNGHEGPHRSEDFG